MATACGSRFRIQDTLFVCVLLTDHDGPHYTERDAEIGTSSRIKYSIEWEWFDATE